MKSYDNEMAGDDGQPAIGSDDSYARGAARDAGTDDGARTGEGAADVAGQDTQRMLEEQREKYLRLAAEYDNFRRRTAKERQEAGTRGQAELLRHIIDALDDLARFSHVGPSAADASTIVEGVAMVEKKLLKALGAAGLQVVDPVDEQFDPALHEAVATEPAMSSEDDHTVARVFQPGYLFSGQLLRPARVVVKQWNG
jgi:molecular chaperone GrpE